MPGIFSKLSVGQRISRIISVSGRRSLQNKPMVKPSTVIERTSKKMNYFNLPTIYQLDKAYDLSPTRFSLESFLEMKKTSSSLPTLRQELLVRLAHLQMFLFSPDSLPQAVQTQESFVELLHLQAQSFRDILHLINMSTVGGID